MKLVMCLGENCFIPVNRKIQHFKDHRAIILKSVKCENAQFETSVNKEWLQNKNNLKFRIFRDRTFYINFYQNIHLHGEEKPVKVKKI